MNLIEEEKENCAWKVLEFYEDQENWLSFSDGMPSEVEKDHGKLAGLAVKVIEERDKDEIERLSSLINIAIGFY